MNSASDSGCLLRAADLALEDGAAVEAVQLQVVLGRVEQGVLGHETDHLGLLHLCPKARRLAPHRLERAVDRGPAVVGQVHGDLRPLALADVESERFHLGEAAVPGADGFRHPLGHGHVCRGQVGVVGDEHRPRPDCYHAGGRVHPRLADVRKPGRVRGDGVADRLELPGAHFGQVPAFGHAGGIAVEVDGNTQFLPHPRAEGDGQRDGLFCGGFAQGHEGDHVGRAHARVLALVGGEIDDTRRHLHHVEHGVDDVRSPADEGDDAPVVVRVLLGVEHGHARAVSSRRHDATDLGLVAAFGEVGDAFEPAHSDPPWFACSAPGSPWAIGPT